MSKLPMGVLETIEDTIDRWNQFSEAIADEKIRDWPSCIRLKDDMSVVETYITQLEAENDDLKTENMNLLERNVELCEAKADKKRLDKLLQMVCVTQGDYYTRERLDQMMLEEQDHE